MPEGVTTWHHPRACVAHKVEPQFALDGPISGGMIALTIRHALLEDIIKSFGPEPPEVDHVVPGTEELTVLLTMESIPSVIASLIEGYDILRQATQSPSE